MKSTKRTFKSNKTIEVNSQVKKYGPVPAGTLEIAGTWKQYSYRKFFRFFPMNSDLLLSESTGNWLESTGKNPENFRSEYCFHFRRFPVRSCRIRWLSRFFSAGSGHRNHCPGNAIIMDLMTIFPIGWLLSFIIPELLGRTPFLINKIFEVLFGNFDNIWIAEGLNDYKLTATLTMSFCVVWFISFCFYIITI